MSRPTSALSLYPESPVMPDLPLPAANPNDSSLRDVLNLLAQNQAQLARQPGSSVARDARLPDVPMFSGSRLKSSQFLVQLQNFFSGQANRFQEDHVKISYIITRLEGLAFAWIEPILLKNTLPENHRILTSIDHFLEAFNLAFRDPHEKVRATNDLLELKQGRRSALAYWTEFATLLYKSSITKESARQIFERGLNDNVKDRLADKDYSVELDAFVQEVINLDYRLYSRRTESGTHRRYPPAAPHVASPAPHVASPLPPGVAPMQVDGLNVNDAPSEAAAIRRLPKQAQLERCRQENRCFYCKEVGHGIQECSVRPNKGSSAYRVSNVICENRSSKAFFLTGTLPGSSSPRVMLDSGATGIAFM